MKYVINFDYPNSSEDYVHRIGRTGRSKQAGIAYTFFSTNNMRQAKDLISILEEAHQIVPDELIEMANMAKNHMSSMYNITLNFNIALLQFIFNNSFVIGR